MKKMQAGRIEVLQSLRDLDQMMQATQLPMPHENVAEASVRIDDALSLFNEAFAILYSYVMSLPDELFRD